MRHSKSPATPIEHAPNEVPIAPRWHTALLVALYFSVAVTGLCLRGSAVVASIGSPTERIAQIYLPLIVVQLGLAAYVCRIGRGKNALWSLIGKRWSNGRRVVVDILLAIAGWLVILAIENAWRAFVPSTSAMSASLPRSISERLVWALASIVVGCSEELVFRGYLLTQLTAITRRVSIGIALQALIFGLVHAEQGGGAMVRTAIYGVMLAILARWRRSLIPGTICHVWTDLASGLLGR